MTDTSPISKSCHITTRATDREIAAWKQAARKLGLNRSEWLRLVADRAAAYDPLEDGEQTTKVKP